MKFFSVFVSGIFYAVTFAYPDQQFQRFAQNNDPNGAEIQNPDMRRGYAQNEQIPAAPIYGPNTYLNTQNVHNRDIQPSTTQYGSRIGPGFSYQNPKNERINKYFPTGPALHHIISKPAWFRELYAALKPTTKYTVIHPNGTIEHTNELHSTAARHPNYVMVKAQDILAKLDQANNVGNLNAPPIQRVQNTLTENSIFTGQRNDSQPNSSNIQTQFTSSKTIQRGPLDGSQNSTSANDELSSSSSQSLQDPIIPNANPNSEPFINSPRTLPQKEVSQIQQRNVISQNEQIGNKDNTNASALNPRSDQPQSKQEDLQLQSNEPLNLQQKAVAANPLPIYPIQSLPITTVSDKPYISPAAADAPTNSSTQPKQHAVIKLPNPNNDQDIVYTPPVFESIKDASVLPTFDGNRTDNKEKQPDNLPSPSKSSTSLPTPSQNETLPVILPTAPLQKTLTEVEIPSPIDESDKIAIYNAKISNDIQNANNKSENSYQTAILEAPLRNSAIKLDNNDQNILYNPPVIKNIKEASVAPSPIKEKQSDNSTIPPNSTTTLEAPHEIETLPIILPAVSSQESLTEVEIPSPKVKLDKAKNVTQDIDNKSANSSQSFEKDDSKQNVNKVDLLDSSTPNINGTNANATSGLDIIPENNTNTVEVKKNITTVSTKSNDKEKQSNDSPIPPNSTTIPEAKLDEAKNTTQDNTNKNANFSQPFEMDDSEKNINEVDRFGISTAAINGTNANVTSGLDTNPKNKTNAVEVEKDVTNIDILNETSSVVNDTPNTPPVPWTWFNFSDKEFWEAVRNNSNSFYFFFMPPQPIVSKVKTTIFPNGTTLEEITETVPDSDGEPKETKTSRIV